MKIKLYKWCICTNDVGHAGHVNGWTSPSGVSSGQNWCGSPVWSLIPVFDTAIILTCLRDRAGFTRVFRTICFSIFFLVCHTGLIPEFYTRAILVLISFLLSFFVLLELISIFFYSDLFNWNSLYYNFLYFLYHHNQFVFEFEQSIIYNNSSITDILSYYIMILESHNIS